jgi:hypothetical protein
MSNFYCEKCGALCEDSPGGYVSGCEHYPADIENDQTLARLSRMAFGRMARDFSHHQGRVVTVRRRQPVEG